MSLDDFISDDGPKASGELHDDLCYREVEAVPNTAVPWWLMASYAYYCRDTPILTDGCFDWLGKYISANWKKLKHRHKHLIKPEESGKIVTGSHIGEDDYPGMTKGAAERLILTLPRRKK